MRDLGNRTNGSTIFFHFHSKNTTGVPTTLSGGVVSVYKDNDLTQNVTGVTLIADFDGVTGLNSVEIDLTDAFYTTDTDYSVVITTGTVGGTSVIGSVIGTFSIEKRIVDDLTANALTKISNQVDSDLTVQHGAGAWQTAVGFSTHSAADVWAVPGRTITGGTIDNATSPLQANLLEINSDSVVGNAATLTLASLSVINPAGSAVFLQGQSAGGHGVEIISDQADGINIQATTSGSGIAASGATAGMSLAGVGGLGHGLSLSSANANGLEIVGGSLDNAVQITTSANLDGINFTVGTGNPVNQAIFADLTEILTQGLTEQTLGNIASNFGLFYNNANNPTTTQVVDDVGGGAGGTDWTASERSEIRHRLGITGATTAPGATPSLALEASVQSVLTTGGAGPWTTGGAGGQDWTATEREQIRNRLGIDGTASAPTATPTLSLEASVQSVLTTGGTGPWTTATGFSTHSAADVDSTLTASHGSGSWQSADVSALALEASVQSVLITGGAGPWTTAATAGLALESSVQSIITTGGPGPWTTGAGSSLTAEDVLIQAVTTNVENNAGKFSLGAAVMAMFNANTTQSPGNLRVNKPSDDSLFNTYPVVRDAAADNLVSVDG